MSSSNQSQHAVNQIERADRVREAVAKHPRKMTLQLARELGVPELEIIRALPHERVMELDVSRWEELIRSFEAVGPVHVIVSNDATTMEAVGQFGGFSLTGEFFNVQSGSLDMHIRWGELSAAFAVEKLGHMGGPATYSMQFFDRSGAAAFKVFLNFGDAISPDHFQLFSRWRESYRRQGTR